MNTELLKTPDEFIEEESKKLKEYLNNYDIQVNKLGFVGFLMNLLGNIRYDLTQFYQGLHRESFVALAEQANNLYMHSFIYGYKVPFATPATADGTFVFDFTNLPRSQSSKRFVTLSNITFKYDNIEFKTTTSYRFVEEDNVYYAIIYLDDGTTQYIPSPTGRIVVPFFNVKQAKQVSETFQLPGYEYGTYYPYEFNMEDDYLSDLQIYVIDDPKKPSDDFINYGELFEYKSVKYLDSQFSKTCFLRALSPHEYIIEFGSGIRGIHIANASVKLVKTLSKGKKGHISTNKELQLDKTSISNLRVIEGDNETSRAIQLKQFEVHFNYSDNGQNTPEAEDLKTDIIKFIQTRDFLIDEKDYYNLTDGDKTDLVYSFRKSHVLRNDFYLHKVLRDEYEIPYLTNCLNIKRFNTEDTLSGLTINSIFETDGDLEGFYQYVIFATNGFHVNQAIEQVIEYQPSISNAGNITWDEYSNSEYYIIIVQNLSDNTHRIFNTQETSFLDIGQSSSFINHFIESFESDLTPVISTQNCYIFSPEFIINERTFKSPFVYKYDQNMNWFDGYLFYDNFIMLFSRTMEKLRQHVIPHFQLNIKYNYEKFRTEFYIISPQSSIDYIVLVTIPGTLINQQKAQRLDENIFYIEYSETFYGIFETSIIFELDIYYSDDEDNIIENIGRIVKAETSEFYQLQTVNDQLKLLNYVSTFDDEYILSLPLIEKDKYLENQTNIDIQLISNIVENNIEGKRFPNDEVQFRFMNTDIINSLYLKTSTIQGYDFNLKLPLKLKIDVIYNSDYLELNPTNLPKEKEDLYFEVAKLLQQEYSGNQITFYNSKLVDFIHTNRSFIKSISVEVKDSNDVIIDNGIESYDEKTMMVNLQKQVNDDTGLDKMDILNYFPHYFYWDVDNIDFNYAF